MSDQVTIPRDLFERLTDCAMDLAEAWHWKRAERRPRYVQAIAKLDATIAEAVYIRDHGENRLDIDQRID